MLLIQMELHCFAEEAPPEGVELSLWSRIGSGEMVPYLARCKVVRGSTPYGQGWHIKSHWYGVFMDASKTLNYVSGSGIKDAYWAINKPVEITL